MPIFKTDCFFDPDAKVIEGDEIREENENTKEFNRKFAAFTYAWSPVVYRPLAFLVRDRWFKFRTENVNRCKCLEETVIKIENAAAVNPTPGPALSFSYTIKG